MTEVRRLTATAVRDQLPLLLVAAAIVGVAISMDGDGRRLVNGIGAVVWVVAAFRIGMYALSAGATARQLVLVAAVVGALSWLIRPSDPLWAAIGFGWGGVIVGWIGRERGSILGALLGALWLPAHLLVAVGRAIARNLRDEPAALRTDPPPTAILVPAIMVASAWIFAALAAQWRSDRDRTGSLLQPRSLVRERNHSPRK